MNKFTGLVRRCVDDYGMISREETVAVGVSGGKDSLALLCALANLRRFHPARFKLRAVSLDMGFGGADYSRIEKLCNELDVPYTVEKRDFARVIFQTRKEKNPCALCSKMRRGALHDTIAALGVRKIALAHHMDDAIETFLLSLIYEGRVSCFRPVTYMSRAGVTQIRPLLYAGEAAIADVARRYKLPVMENPCPMNGASKREDMKTLLKSLGEAYPGVAARIFGAMRRLPLEGWSVTGQ